MCLYLIRGRGRMFNVDFRLAAAEGTFSRSHIITIREMRSVLTPTNLSSQLDISHGSIFHSLDSVDVFMILTWLECSLA